MKLEIPFSKLEKSDLSAQDTELLTLAENARNRAYAPYSGFSVGCALLLENGEILTGNNQENAAYPSGLCAERVAIFHAMSKHPAQKIEKMFITGGDKNAEYSQPLPPCGACRQVILEYENRQKHPITIYFSGVKSQIIRLESTSVLLPFSFDASFLE